jgi:hypothetical protein
MPDSKDLKDLDSQLKKTIISAESFKRGSSVDFSKGIQKTTIGLAGYVRQLVNVVSDLEKIVNNNSRKITSLKNISKTQSSRISGENIGAKLPGSSTSNVEDSIATITKSVTSIAEILAGRKKTLDNAAAFDRRKAEQEKRGLAEDKLEKRFEGLKSEAEKVIAPVKSILDKIIDFFVTVFLGRVVYKLLEWFGDPKNADKVRSIGRFLGDHWPKLLALYITFGTSFGRFALGLTKVVARGAVSLLSKILLLSKAKKLRAAGKFLGGGKGRGLAGVLGTGVALGGAYAVTQGLKGDGEDQKTQGLAGGGFVIPKIPRFSGGGLNFKGMLGGMFAKAQEMSSGFVSGEKGVDKVPAMLSDGEFVMSTGAVQKYGVDTLESMNAAGGGTNKPKIMNGTTYAAGGGLMGENPDPNYKNPSQDKRLDLMKSLERYGSAIATGSSESVGGGSRDLVKAIKNLSTVLGGGGGASTKSANASFKSGGSTGSLLTDPVGAVARIANNMGIKTPNVPSSKPSSSKPSGPGFFQELKEKLTGSGAATYRDAGTIYAKQMLGGFGGPVSEIDLSGQSQAELQKAIQRAKKRTGSQINSIEAKIKKLEADGASSTPKGKQALAIERSYLKKLKSGEVRVQYADYADEKGKMSESAKNSKNILGQFWAKERSKEQGGGYRIEDKYDFDMLKKKDEKSGKMRDMTPGELFMEGMLGKGKTTQQRLQAAYLLNPFKGKGGDVDMVLGGKRNAAESMGLAGSRTMLGGMLGISGNPNQAKQSQVAKTKPKNIRGVKPSTQPKPLVVYGPPAPKKRNVRGGGTSTRTPSFSASNPHAHRSKQETLGLMR